MENTINFKTWSQAFIFKYEFMGQISDGKYENTRPYNHFEWLYGLNITVIPNKPSARTHWMSHIHKYSFKEWLSACKRPDTFRKGEWAWATRVLAYGTLGKMPLSLEQVKVVFNSYDIVYYAEYSGGDYKKWICSADDTYNKYYAKKVNNIQEILATIGLTIDEFERMFNANKYTVEDFERDYPFIMSSINNVVY